MKCDRVRDLTSSALDGALETNQSEAYFDHLQSCPPCLAFHEELRLALALLEDVPVVEAREGFEDRVWARLAEEGHSGSGSPSSPGFALRIRERFREWVASSAGWERWSLAGVAAGVFALALLSPDPAPRSGSALVATPGVESGLATSQTPASIPASVSSRANGSTQEDEFVAEMPEAIREYLRHSEDLRLPVGEDRYRRSNYSYPVRRVADPSLFHLTGESFGPSPSSSGGGADETVISF